MSVAVQTVTADTFARIFDKARREHPQTFKPEATRGRADGVYSFRKHVQEMGFQKDSRVVFFHGKEDPWTKRMSRLSFVKEHYR